MHLKEWTVIRCFETQVKIVYRKGQSLFSRNFPLKTEGGEAAPPEPPPENSIMPSGKRTSWEKRVALIPLTPEERAPEEGRVEYNIPKPREFVQDWGGHMITRPARMMYEFARAVVGDIQEAFETAAWLSEAYRDIRARGREEEE